MFGFSRESTCSHLTTSPAKAWGFLLDTDISADRCYDKEVAPRPLMSLEHLKAFLEKAKNDTSFLKRLNAAADVDDVAAIAVSEGFLISAEELKTLAAKASDEELVAATGGRNQTANAVVAFIPFVGPVNQLSQSMGGPTIGDMF